MELVKDYPSYNVLSEERKAQLTDALVSLHVHSFYSLLDGMINPQQLVDYTLELGQPAVCISDHGNMYSLVELAKLAKEKGQKSIIAMEAYIVRNMHIKSKQESGAENGNSREHLLLIAMNEVGYKNLMKLASIAATQGFYYRPRIDDESLKQHSDGLIATSACIGSRFAQMIIRGNYVECRRELKTYMKMFPGRFFLEIQPTKDYLQKIVNHKLIKLANELKIPLIATTDSHYLKRSDARVHETLLAMQSNDTLSNPLRWRFPGDTYFVTSRKQMIDLFEEECESEIDSSLLNKDESSWKINPSDEIFEREIEYLNKKTGKVETITKKFIKFKHDIPREIIEIACDNTIVVSDMCDFELKFDQTYLPKVQIPENEEFENWYKTKLTQSQKERKEPLTKQAYYLRYMCIKGLKELGITSKEYRDRLDYELDVIISMGFPDYFLLLEDVVSWCRKNNIPVGPGRGSAAGSLVSYAIGITNVDPIKYGLLFERFLNPKRGKLPEQYWASKVNRANGCVA